jgi:hypothetical protein
LASRTFRSQVPRRARQPHQRSLQRNLLQLRDVEFIPQPRFIKQVSLIIEQYAFVLQQLQFRVLVLAARRVLPVALVTTNKLHSSAFSRLQVRGGTYAGTCDASVTRYLGRERIDA